MAVAEPDSEHDALAPQATTSLSTLGWKGSIRVLVVDPDERFGKLLKGYLEERGWQVEWVSDGRKALSRWREIGPDLVVTEIQGEELDGFEFIEAVGRMPKAPPVVVCTRMGGVTAWNDKSLESLGVVAILARPIRFPDLGATLEGILLGA
jgi:CheY-like chemotaxis protein